MSHNQLKHAQSAYLKQHQHNPIHWYEWGEEAFEAARSQNLPLFVSIGYSSCHWCHVMAHESFENPDVALYLNQNFISIKVDREEHPDVDQYFQMCCQLFNQNGGWPLSVFLTSDARPFFVGTYFSSVSKQGRPSFLQLLHELVRAYQNERESILKNCNEVEKLLEEGLIPPAKQEIEGHFPPPISIIEALKQFADQTHGGYGQPPKFPNFTFLEWAFEQIQEGMIPFEASQHLFSTLEKMLCGGVYDHLRGGFHRYSTDEKWLVPHFEKMLYDQAGLLRVLCKATPLLPLPLLFDAFYQTLDYLQFEMFDEQGHFFSSQDADSEGEEGLYFTFTQDEFITAIKAQGNELSNRLNDLLRWFQITPDGNFERGLNVISLDHKYKEELYSQTNWDLIRQAKKALLTERKKRIPPATDNKGVASWNFSIVSALIECVQYAPIETFKEQALKLLDQALPGVFSSFILDNQIIFHDKTYPVPQLKHSTTLDQPSNLAEDYINFLDMIFRAYELTANIEFKQQAQTLLEFILENFISQGRLSTRLLDNSDGYAIPNLPQESFDGSQRSPLSLLIQTGKRIALSSMDNDTWQTIRDIEDVNLPFVLRNPLGSGLGLRASTYPDSIYRLIKIPSSWSESSEWQRFRARLLSRFVIDYHEELDESFQICHMQACEYQGHGLRELIDILTPPEDENTESNV